MPATPLSTPETLIELHDVVKTFKTHAGEFTALKKINLTFASGEFTSIMGKSGSGKSTLINMITGIDHPTSGVVRVGDVELGKKSEGQLAVWRGRAMGIVFQFFQLLPTLTILENVMLPMDYCDMYPAAERETRALDLLKLLNLDEMAHKLPAALAGGQQQIAAIARALANDPPIIIADEPTGNLDTHTEKLILDIFENLAGRGKTILIVTHDPVLARRSTRRILISDGELVNDHVAQALGILPHNQLLKISKLVSSHTYAPGAVLARQGVAGEGLTIITHGTVEVLSQRRFRQPEVVSTLGPGRYFSLFDLLEIESCDLSFRVASGGPLAALCLTGEQFTQYIESNPSVEPLLRKAAAEHGLSYCPGRSPNAAQTGPAKPRRRFFGGLL